MLYYLLVNKRLVKVKRARIEIALINNDLIFQLEGWYLKEAILKLKAEFNDNYRRNIKAKKKIWWCINL